MPKLKPLSQSLGKKLNFGSFSGKQAVIFGSVFSVSFVVISGIFGISIYIALAFSLWASLTCAFLSGSHPHRYWSKIYPFGVPNWSKGQARYSSPVGKKKLENQEVKVTRNTSKRLNPIENWLDLVTLCRIEKDGKAIGCYIMGANDDNHNDPSKIIIKFGFRCQGIHPLQLEEQFEVINNNLTTGFKEIFDSTFTFRWSSFCDYKDAVSYLKNRLQNPVTPESEYLDHAKLARKKELSNQKKRKLNNLSVYTTFTQKKMT